MKTRNSDNADRKEKVTDLSLIWRFTVLFLPIAVVALMLISVSFVKGKIALKHHVNNSYRAGDVAVFVAMPLLHAVMK